MACSTVRLPLLHNHAIKRYAAAMVAQSVSKVDPEVQVLPNKITAVALDAVNPIAQVSIIFRAGSRNETYTTQGTTHHLRIAAGLSSKRSSSFGITRNIQQLGGIITATTDRETIAYTLQITRDKLENALTFLEDVALQHVFKPWELSDQLPRLRYEITSIPSTTRIFELLHKAAYRTGLGYSLYSPKRQLGKISPETLQHFINSWFLGTRCAVVGTGVSLSDLSSFASGLNVCTGDKANEPAKYVGGEVRKDRNSPMASVAVAAEGVGFDKAKEAIAFAILQRAAGTGPRVKWGSSNSPLYKAVAKEAGTESFIVSAFNANYTDSGLFGFILSAPSNVAGSLVTAAHKWFKQPSISSADIARGKAELKCDVLCALDNSITLVENLGQQALIKGNVSSPSTIIAEIDKVSDADITSLLARWNKGKLSVAAIGDLCSVPFIEQLN